MWKSKSGVKRLFNKRYAYFGLSEPFGPALRVAALPILGCVKTTSKNIEHHDDRLLDVNSHNAFFSLDALRLESLVTSSFLEGPSRC